MWVGRRWRCFGLGVAWYGRMRSTCWSWLLVLSGRYWLVPLTPTNSLGNSSASLSWDLLYHYCQSTHLLVRFPDFWNFSFLSCWFQWNSKSHPFVGNPTTHLPTTQSPKQAYFLAIFLTLYLNANFLYLVVQCLSKKTPTLFFAYFLWLQTS